MKSTTMAMILTAATMSVVAPAVGAENQPYAGQETRTVKALSPEAIAGLLAGAGLGYAKAAELNGWPGPAHALELSDRLELSAGQVAELEALRADMLARTVPLGEELIAAEAALDRLFAEGDPSALSVEAATARIATIEGRLRAAHLVTHLRTAPVLSRHQAMLYARERGYGGEGHAGHGG